MIKSFSDQQNFWTGTFGSDGTRDETYNIRWIEMRINIKNVNSRNFGKTGNSFNAFKFETLVTLETLGNPPPGNWAPGLLGTGAIGHRAKTQVKLDIPL